MMGHLLNRGKVSIRVTSADIARTVSCMLSEQILLENMKIQNDLVFTAIITEEGLRKLKTIHFSCGEQIEVISHDGFSREVTVWVKRPVFLTGIVLLIFLNIWIPSRVFFFRVQGNHVIPQKEIIEAAQDCGVRFGVSRRKINSERIKNDMLEKLPELRWVGITTKGAEATISVREGKNPKSKKGQDMGITSVVAARDGVIEECTVLKGNPLCRTGQSVKKGQVLISGYTDCGIAIRAEHAEGEILARTNRDLTVISPDHTVQRAEKIGETKRYSLLLGKKLIKFYNDSGISGTECVKMYSDYRLKLPGGFVLPVALVCERQLFFRPSEMVAAAGENPGWLRSQSESYLNNQMVAGKILDSHMGISRIPGAYQLNGSYSCLEMIGKVKSEEIVK